jgi:hypothetical protein
VYAHTKQDEQVCCHGGDTSILNSISQVTAAGHFPANAVRCEFTNAGFQFVLVE